MARRSEYAFVTRWVISATPDRVWSELVVPEEWPVWWRGVERVETLRAGAADGVGGLRRYTWRSRLPYRLIFTMETTRVEPRRLIEGRASGALKGRGALDARGRGGRHAGPVRLDGGPHQALDEAGGAGGAAPLRVESRCGDGVGRQGLLRRLGNGA